MRPVRFFAISLGLAFICAPFLAGHGQSRVNSTGNGGIHTIQGRIYLPSGKVLDTPVAVQLQSSTYSTITVYSDHGGGFAFRSLAPGNYTIVFEADENFETAREYITIDSPVQGAVRIAASPKTVMLPLHLQFRQSVRLKNEVVNAKWSSVPESAIERYQKGLELLNTNRVDEAVAEFRKSIELFRGFSPPYTELGKIHLKVGNLNDAVNSFRSALRYDQNDFDAHLNLGVALLNLKKYDESEPEFVTAAYLNRSAVTPHYYLGIIYVVKNDLDIARKAFETAKELKGDKTLPTLHKYLGRIYMAKHLEKEAIRELETYLKLMPKAQDAEKIRKDITDLKSKQN